MRKKVKHISLIAAGWLTVALTLTSCGSPAPVQEETPPAPAHDSVEELAVFTLEELAAYDGKEGRAAYVAVGGLVYDFTGLGRWRGGTHNGFEAGRDLTEALQEISPHGDRVLDRAPVVGVLVD